MSDVSPLSGISGLSFDSTLLSALLFFCLALLPYLIFFCQLVLSSELFPENSSIFFIKSQAFLYDSCLAVRRSKLVSGMCSLLPYGTGICCYAFILYFLILYCFCPFLFYTFQKSGIDKSTEWSRIPACPSIMCFFNRDDTEGTNSSKIQCPIFVYVLFYVNQCRD